MLNINNMCLKEKINIEPQKLATLKRKDFDVFELGYKLMEKSHRLACGMKPYFPLVF